MLIADLARGRGLKRAPASLRRFAAVRAARLRIAEALHGCGEEERAVIAMLLVERLTPAEAAAVLGCSVNDVTRTYRALLADLRRVSRGVTMRTRRRAGAVASIVPMPRERRA